MASIDTAYDARAKRNAKRISFAERIDRSPRETEVSREKFSSPLGPEWGNPACPVFPSPQQPQVQSSYTLLRHACLRSHVCARLSPRGPYSKSSYACARDWVHKRVQVRACVCAEGNSRASISHRRSASPPYVHARAHSTETHGSARARRWRGVARLPRSASLAR